MADRIRGLEAVPSAAARPRLLFGASEVSTLQQRAAAAAGCLESIRGKAIGACASAAAEVNLLEPYLSSQAAVDASDNRSCG